MKVELFKPEVEDMIRIEIDKTEAQYLLALLGAIDYRETRMNGLYEKLHDLGIIRKFSIDYRDYAISFKKL